MKAIIIGLALAALAGCSASVHGSGATSTVASSPAASTPATTTDSSSEVVATPVPDQCLGEVGQDTSVVVAPESTDTQIILRCITGASVALDQTQAGETKCATTSNPHDTVYYWGSKDAHSADKRIYAGTKDGRIVIVPDEDSSTFWIIGGGLAGVTLATGCL